MKAPPWATALALGVACGAAALVLELEPREEPAGQQVPPEPVDDAVTTLLGGLVAGDRVGGWVVLGVRGPRDQEIDVDFARDDVRFTVTIARLGTVGEGAPVQTKTYGLYYGHARPAGVSIPDGAVRAILHNLARRVTAAEDANLVVDGL